MKKLLILILLFSIQAHAQTANGSMDCTVTGNVVVASEEGKFKTYSSIKGGVKANEKVTLNYTVFSDSVYIGIERLQAENKIIDNTSISTNQIAVTAYKRKPEGFTLNDNTYEHNNSLTFSPDYIRFNGVGEFFISRYYKNDWHGIYSNVDISNNLTQTLTLNCRHINDKMDAAFKIFTGYKGRK